MMHRNVLHLIDTGGPGGAETIFRELVTGLNRERWHSVAAIPVRDWLYDALRSDGVEPVVLEARGSFDVRHVAAIYSLARRTGADLVHAHLLASCVYGSAAAMLRRLPVVCTFHGQADVSPDESYRAVKFRIINRSANHVVFVSKSLRELFLKATALDSGRTRVIYNGIDVQSFHPGRDGSLRRELGMAPGALLIGAVGNVRPSKAYDVLLRAAALLRDRGVPIRIAIIGQTTGVASLYRELESLHAQLGLGERVVFTGFREDIPRLMRNLDLYASSSSAEGFSLTTVQAMATALPVVATRCGGPEEIIDHEVTGLLVENGSVEGLADGIQRLVEDPALRQRLADSARGAVERRFSVHTMVAAYESVYDECLGRCERSASRPAICRD